MKFFVINTEGSTWGLHGRVFKQDRGDDIHFAGTEKHLPLEEVNQLNFDDDHEGPVL